MFWNKKKKGDGPYRTAEKPENTNKKILLGNGGYWIDEENILNVYHPNKKFTKTFRENYKLFEMKSGLFVSASDGHSTKDIATIVRMFKNIEVELPEHIQDEYNKILYDPRNEIK